jgi:hypothetical protein
MPSRGIEFFAKSHVAGGFRGDFYAFPEGKFVVDERFACLEEFRKR